MRATGNFRNTFTSGFGSTVTQKRPPTQEFDETRLEKQLTLAEKLRSGFKSAMANTIEEEEPPEKPATPFKGSRTRALMEAGRFSSPTKATLSAHAKESLKIERKNQQRRFFFTESKKMQTTYLYNYREKTDENYTKVRDDSKLKLLTL